MRYVLSINQNSFDAIQHDDALKRLFVLSLQNECFKLSLNNTFDGLDEPVRPTPGGRKRRLDKENHKKQQKKKVLRWRVNTHCGMLM